MTTLAPHVERAVAAARTRGVQAKPKSGVGIPEPPSCGAQGHRSCTPGFDRHSSPAAHVEAAIRGTRHLSPPGESEPPVASRGSASQTPGAQASHGANRDGSFSLQLSKRKLPSRSVKNKAVKLMNQQDIDEYLLEEGYSEKELSKDDVKVSTKEDATFKGQRVVGNSTHLAKARYRLLKPVPTFNNWKVNFEAQHLIPASLHKNFPALKGIVDSHENGMMLPASYSPSNTAVTHRKPNYYDHAKYTNNVRVLITSIIAYTSLKMNQTTLKRVMAALRPVNKLTKYKYLDDIPLTEFKQAWNAQNPLLKI